MAQVSHVWLNRRKATIVVDRDPSGVINPAVDLLPPDLRYALRRWLNGDQK